MNYGVILAGGNGNRMKNLNIPKQYYEINNKPIFIYTLLAMLKPNVFDKIYIAIQKSYIDLVNDYIKKHVSKENYGKIVVVTGGKERIDTIHNVLKEISSNKINDDDVVVIHDAVRPFVTEKIIHDSIKYAKKYGAVVASVPVEDTMLVSLDNKQVNSIPNRNTLYRGQAPDSFKLKTLIELEKNLNDKEKKMVTGTSQICTINNYPIIMIPGDSINFKITNDSDLIIAEKLILSKDDNVNV